jgi:hypothetical protein
MQQKHDAVMRGDYLRAEKLHGELHVLLSRIAEERLLSETLDKLRFGGAQDAIRHSQLHKVRELVIDHKVAVFITGQLRLRDENHLDRIRKALSQSDCFVVSYWAYQKSAAALANRTLLLTMTEMKGMRLHRSLWQWYQLSRGLQHWREILEQENYHTICRYRTDISLPERFSFQHCIGQVDQNGLGIVHARSDYFFYSTGTSFIRIFTSMFHASSSIYSKLEASREEVSRYQSIINALGGLHKTCLTAEMYAPLPREVPLQSTAVLVVPKKLIQVRNSTLRKDSAADLLTTTTPARRRIQSLVKVQSQKLVKLFCGCKYTLGSCQAPPWKGCQGGGHQEFQSEPALA